MISNASIAKFTDKLRNNPRWTKQCFKSTATIWINAFKNQRGIKKEEEWERLQSPRRSGTVVEALTQTSSSCDGEDALTEKGRDRETRWYRGKGDVGEKLLEIDGKWAAEARREEERAKMAGAIRLVVEADIAVRVEPRGMDSSHFQNVVIHIISAIPI